MRRYTRGIPELLFLMVLTGCADRFHDTLAECEGLEGCELIERVSRNPVRYHKELLEGLSHPNPKVQILSAGVLGSHPEMDAENALQKLLSDSIPEVAGAAMLSIAQRKKPGTERFLLPFLKSTEAETRLTALVAVSRLDLPETGRAVLPLLSDSNAEIRATAALVLGQLGTQEAGPLLISSLQDEDEKVRAFSIEALSDLGFTGARSSLLEKLEDPVWRVRLSAIYGLVRLFPNDSGILDKLRRNVNSESHPAVREALDEATRIH